MDLFGAGPSGPLLSGLFCAMVAPKLSQDFKPVLSVQVISSKSSSSYQNNSQLSKNQWIMHDSLTKSSSFWRKWSNASSISSMSKSSSSKPIPSVAVYSADSRMAVVITVVPPTPWIKKPLLLGKTQSNCLAAFCSSSFGRSAWMRTLPLIEPCNAQLPIEGTLITSRIHFIPQCLG